MSGESLLIILVIGAIAGWLAGVIVRGSGFGLVTNICVGIVGALVGSWILPALGVHFGSRMASSIVSATFGAVVLLLVLRLARTGGRRRSRAI